MSELDVYLDVDGVVLPVCLPDLTPRAGWSNWATSTLTMGGAYSVDLVAAINALADRPGVQIWWLTTWLERAPVELVSIGLNGQDWPVLGHHEHRNNRGTGWWKFAAIKAHRRPGRRALWLDDDIDSDPEALMWAEGDEQLLGVTPRAHHGLSVWNWREAMAWVDGAVA